MKSETIQVTIPKEIIKSAEKIGISKQDIKEMMRTFVILDITASLSKLSKKEARIISKKIKVSAWRKTKEKLKI